ncbi:MAG TPA: glycosyltransferase [Chitinophagaceae bacterium]|nr:glycosyltransferase [Chitinophagaceae bacterium]
MIPGRELDFCLLIPCYNNLPGLLTSLNSVVYPGPYLVLVVDDGSAEPVTSVAVEAGLNGEKPVMILRNETNLGITQTLNRGISWIEENTHVRYIARLDCADTCTEDRFTKQVEWLDAHPDTGLLGTWCRFEEKGTGYNYSYTTPTGHEKILKAMYLRNVFIHPTVMFRASLLPKAGHYPGNFEFAEDYAFFWKLITLQKAHVIGTFMVICEINREGLSYANKGKQLISRWHVVRKYGTSKALKILAFLRISLLFILPKRLTLLLKQRKRP